MGVARLAAALCMAALMLGLNLLPACAEPCLAGQSALGVSRVVEIDTTGGPRFGAQYPGQDFLHHGEVVLTFDDGPSRSKTPLILSALAAHCTKATFFIVGRMALLDPELLRETATQGHTIGLHTWSHRKLTATTTAKAKEEIELGHSMVEKSLGHPVAPLFRFPYLSAPSSMLSYLSSRNIATFGIDVDSRDFQSKKPDAMIHNVLAGLQAKGKGIILFHDIQASTAAGIKALLDELKKRNFKVVHVTTKSVVPTVPTFDQQAERLIARSHVASSRKLLEKPPEFYGPDAPQDGPSAGTAEGPAEAPQEELPWLKNDAPETAQPSPPATQPGPPKSKPWWQF